MESFSLDFLTCVHKFCLIAPLNEGKANFFLGERKMKSCQSFIYCYYMVLVIRTVCLLLGKQMNASGKLCSPICVCNYYIIIL